VISHFAKPKNQNQKKKRENCCFASFQKSAPSLAPFGMPKVIKIEISFFWGGLVDHMALPDSLFFKEKFKFKIKNGKIYFTKIK
jgi:hypothetical protein